MRKILFLILALFSTHQLVYAQLQNVQWKRIICQSSTSIELLKTITDEDGNSYTLMYVTGGQVLELTIPFPEGGFIIVKLDKEGQEKWVKTITTNSIANVGTMTFDHSGNLIIGGAYQDTFLYEGIPIKISKDKFNFNSFLLKINSAGNLVWLNTYPCTGYSYITDVATDQFNNVYTAAQFYGSITIGNDSFYSRHYNVVFFKCDPSGNSLWANHLYSGNDSDGTGVDRNQNNLYVFTPQPNCPQQILLALTVDTSLYINGNLLLRYQTGKDVLVEFTNDGKPIRHLLFPETGNINSVLTENNNIYLSGVFYDSLVQDRVSIVSPGTNMYLAKLDELLHFQQAVIVAKGNPIPTDLRYSPEIGLVVVSAFTNNLIFDKDTFQNLDPEEVSSFIANYNNDLKLSEHKYIRGGQFYLGTMSVVGNEVYGSALYKDYCSFGNDTAYSDHDWILSFKTEPYNSVLWKDDAQAKTLQPVVYPNPCTDICFLRFAMPIYGYSYNLYNTLGQLCQNADIQIYDDTNVQINTRNLASGVYYLRLKNCCDNAVTVKLIKN